MNQLTKFLVDGILNEGKGKVIAAYGGGFKPPTAGHFEVVKKALEENPEIEELTIFVGGGERDGLTQAEAILIWEIFQSYLPMKVNIQPSKAPIGDVVRLGKNNLQDTVYFIIGGREGRDDDAEDIASRTKGIEEKYPNMKVKVVTTPDGGMSGTNARQAAKVSYEEFEKYLPGKLSDEEKEMVYNIVSPAIKEIKLPNISDIKEKFKIFLKNLKQEGKETKAAFSLLFKAAKGEIELTDLDKQQIKEQLKDVLKGIFGAAMVAMPAGSLVLLLLKLIKLQGLVTPTAFLEENDPEDGKAAPYGSGYNELKEGDYSPLGYAKRIINGDISFREAMEESGIPFGNLSDLLKKLGAEHLIATSYNLDNLNEKLKPYKFKILFTENEDNITRYTFTTNQNTEYLIDLTKHPETEVKIEYGAIKEGKKSWIKPTNEGEPLKIISTITEIIKEYYSNNPGIEVVKWKATKGKNSTKVNSQRDKLNIRFFKREIPNVKIVHEGQMTKMILPKLNENASYSKDIDIKGKIMQLTQHMLDKGYNIEPLPTIEFVDGDSDNAREFLGKTAYYNPESQTIVLYTEGRHPKDIVRSFAHEMIHHIQNLEGRLGAITTTNTQEDDHLNDIEAEANLKGTMTFRNWTDSLNESILGDKIVCDNCGWSWKIVDGGDDLFICHKCGHDNSPLNEVKPYKHKHGFDDKLGKDPFGLNQFAREIAEEVISEGRYDTLANKLSSIAFEAFKDIHDRGDKEGEFEFRVDHPDDEHDIPSEDFYFDFVGKVEITDDEYEVDGGANAGFDKDGNEITPLLSVKFRIPKNPDWQRVSFDIKDVVRHELEHLTQDGDNVKPSKQMDDDQMLRDLIDLDLLPKADYFRLPKEIDAMLQGLYLKAKKSKRPYREVIDDYLATQPIDSDEKENILKIWRNRAKALSLPVFEYKSKVMENANNQKYTIYCDMDGVLVDFDKQFEKASGGISPREYEETNGKEAFWNLIDNENGVGFWVGMPWMPNGKQLWDYIKPNTPILLSSPSRSNSSRLGKRLWVRNNLPGTKLILANSYNKKNYADSNNILIDDRPSNIDQWKAAGGIGILFISTEQTIKELKELGL